MSRSAEPKHGAPEPGEARGDPGRHPRRGFLARLSLLLGGAGAAAAGIPILGFLLSPLRRETEATWRSVGSVADFPLARTVRVRFLDAEPLPWAGFAARSAAWLRRTGEAEFVAFSTYCTHVGCPVRWEEGARLFMCPCHGGAFYDDGSVAAGPPPRALDRYPVRVRAGEVEILTPPIPLSS